LKNDIISASSAGGFYTDAIQLVRGPSATLPVCTATTTGTTPCPTVNVATPVGYPAYTLIPYVNAGETKTSGFDLDLRGHFDLGDFGKLKAELNYTYIAQYELVVTGTTYDLAGTHGPQSISGDTGNPKNKAVASLTWDEGPLSTTVSVNYTGGFSIIDPSSGYSTCLAALLGRGPSAYGSALSSSVDLQTYGGGAELAYSTLDQDGAVGRFFLAGATYKF
jgi:iron complex outermembrane receptor protein